MSVRRTIVLWAISGVEGGKACRAPGSALDRSVGGGAGDPGRGIARRAASLPCFFNDVKVIVLRLALGGRRGDAGATSTGGAGGAGSRDAAASFGRRRVNGAGAKVKLRPMASSRRCRRQRSSSGDEGDRRLREPETPLFLSWAIEFEEEPGDGRVGRLADPSKVSARGVRAVGDRCPASRPWLD